MLKVRITFTDNKKGNKELEEFLQLLKFNTDIISESEIYKGRGKSIYSNVYIDLENKDTVSVKKDEKSFDENGQAYINKKLNR